MVFSSILFLFYFFPIVLVLYFASPKKIPQCHFVCGQLNFLCLG